MQWTVYSNGKKERFFRTAKEEAIRPGTPLSVEDARRIMARYSIQYNEERAWFKWESVDINCRLMSNTFKNKTLWSNIL